MVATSFTIPIRVDLCPAYYDDFHCLAEGCKPICLHVENISLYNGPGSVCFRGH